MQPTLLSLVLVPYIALSVVFDSKVTQIFFLFSLLSHLTHEILDDNSNVRIVTCKKIRDTQLLFSTRKLFTLQIVTQENIATSLVSIVLLI